MQRDALRYAMERKQFGQPIAEFQPVQAMLADSQAEMVAARCRSPAPWAIPRALPIHLAAAKQSGGNKASVQYIKSPALTPSALAILRTSARVGMCVDLRR